MQHEWSELIMALSEELKKKLDYYEQAYFYTDSPVPFLGDLKIYPVMSKDYYNFYSNLSCLTMDKTIIKTIVKNEETGKEEEKIKPNPKGISMSYEAYLISQNNIDILKKYEDQFKRT